MTNEHPITPPPELVQQLRHSADTWLGQITIAYQAGADQELEACCKWLFESAYPHKVASVYLRTTRRPKPPSLKEQALKELDDWTLERHGLGGKCFICDGLSVATIRRALEALPE